MNITDIFSAGLPFSMNKTGNADANSSKSTKNVTSRDLNLSVGDKLTGKVIAKDGNNVQIDLGNDNVLSAKLNQNISLNQGQTLTFEVKSSGSGSVSLSPLFTNTSVSDTVMNALQSAGLPMDERSLELVNSLINENMPISRETLISMNAQITSVPIGNIQDAVQLHKLGVPINEDNIEQIISYKNYEHQIVGGINDLIREIPDAFEQMQSAGELNTGLSLYQDLLDLVSAENPMGDESILDQPIGAILDTNQLEELAKGLQDLNESDVFSSQNVTGEATVGEVFTTISNLLEQSLSIDDLFAKEDIQSAKTLEQEALAVYGESDTAKENIPLSESVSYQELSKLQESVPGQQNVEDSLLNLLQQAGKQVLQTMQGELSGSVLPQSDSAAGQELFEQTMQLLETELAELLGDNAISSFSGGILSQTTAQILSRLTGQDASAFMQYAEVDTKESLASLLQNSGMRELLQKGLEETLKLNPKTVKEEGQIKDYYTKINEQTEKILHTLEHSLAKDSPAAQTAGRIHQNLQFMNDLNQMFTYVQLPMKMSGNDAHGDLYIYTNKKNLAAKDGNVSALLHLDMDHLGTTDVYVSMNSAQHVNTHFYLRDEASLDLIAEHIDELNAILEKRGYSMKSELSMKDPLEQTKNVMDEMLSHSTTVRTKISKNGFDARA